MTNDSDYKADQRALDRVLWSSGLPDSAVDAAADMLDRIPRGEGRLTIRAMKLGGLGKGSVPWFEWMRFRVELKLPQEPVPDSGAVRR